MQRTAWVLAICVLTLGCQKASQPTVTTTKGTKAKPTEVSKAATTEDDGSEVRKAEFVTADSKRAAIDSPESLVKKFVAALRVGDARTVRNLLTEKARYETRRHGLEVDPQMFPNTSFEVGETDYTSDLKNVAYVGCKWFEPTSNAKEFELFWVTKREEDGWRISGFATSLENDDQTQLLNFENVPAMLAIMDKATGETKPAKGGKAVN